MMKFLCKDYNLSILVPTFNGRDRLPKLLASLDKYGYIGDARIQIIIADNCSTDQTADYLTSLAKSISFVYNKRNIGFQGNVLKLLFLSRGKYNWIIGDDDEVRIFSSVVLDYLNSCDYPRLYTSTEEYQAVTAWSAGDYIAKNSFLDILPFGFISSTIQPNTAEILDCTIAFSREDRHSSPHFFSRWLFLQENGLGSLSELCLRDSFVGRAVTAANSTRSRASIFRDKLHILRTPWIPRHYCYNWYSAYVVASKDKSLRGIGNILKYNERGFFLSEIENNPGWAVIYWLTQFPFMYARDFRYGHYLAMRFWDGLVLFLVGSNTNRLK